MRAAGARLVEAVRDRGVSENVLHVDTADDHFISLTVGSCQDAPRSFPLAIALDEDEPASVVIAPLVRPRGLRWMGEWTNECIPNEDIIEFTADWIAASALGRLVLVRRPFRFSSLLTGRVGVLDPTNPRINFPDDTTASNREPHIIKRFKPLQ